MPARVCVLARRDGGAGAGDLVPALVGRLRDRGCDTHQVDPDRLVLDLACPELQADLFVLGSGTESALSLAGALTAGGSLVVNPYDAAAACRDKVVQTRMLLNADLPVPDTWVTTDPRRLTHQLDDGPLVVKDPRASRGRGPHVVRAPADLDRVPRRDRPWLAMRYHQPEGDDLKLYRIGDEVFGVRRRFPARSLAEKVGRPLRVSAGLRRLVMQCGEPFGITLYGVDVIVSRGFPWIVDMSVFPGFEGVPGAGARIADHLLATTSLPGRTAAHAQHPGRHG